MNEKAFQATGKAGSVVRQTAREAAVAYFESFPTSRKCNVVEGHTDGPFFVITYGRKSEGKWPLSFKDVTKKQAHTLEA